MHLIAKEWLTVKKGRISAEVAFIQYGRCQSASMANTCGVWHLAGRRWQRQMRRYEELLYVETPLRFFSSLHRYIRFEWGVRRGLRFFFKNPNYFCPTKNGMMFYEHWTNQQNLDSNLAKTFIFLYFIDLVSIDCQLICRQHNLLRHLELVWLVSILARNNK